MEFRQSTNEDIQRNWEIIQEARHYLKSQGIDQWQKEYPDKASIAEDVKRGNGYVLTENGVIVGYVCISFDGEEAYEALRGTWKSIQPYAVIHRLAVDNAHKGQGLASLLFSHGEELCRARGIHSVKIDTDEDNAAMKHLMEKNGYFYCGVITFDNSEKIAFEKLV